MLSPDSFTLGDVAAGQLWYISLSRFVERPRHGGPNRGQGRKPKPPEEKYRRRLFALPPEVDDKLQKYKGDKSKLIANLLSGYFEALESL